MSAHRCPTCNGHGLTNRPPWVAGDQETWSSYSSGPYKCRACNGSGVVWAPAETTEGGSL